MSIPEDLPPSYDAGDGDDDALEILEPTILILSRQSIHAESSNSPALYTLSRGIASLTHATSTVELQRVDRTIQTNRYGEPTIKPRTRHIYDIRHVERVSGGTKKLPPDSPRFFAQAMSRKTLGSVALQKPQSATKQHRFQALPVTISSQHDTYGLATFTRGANPIFELDQRQGYEWIDSSNGNNAVIAIQDNGEDQHRLIVTASLSRYVVDALVVLWCCQIFQHSADNVQQPIKQSGSGETYP